jgi:hypothetical protein
MGIGLGAKRVDGVSLKFTKIVIHHNLSVLTHLFNSLNTLSNYPSEDGLGFTFAQVWLSYWHFDQ